MAPRLPTGSSDPISFTCTCSASKDPDGGYILLFYRYFAASPPLDLPPKDQSPANVPSSLAAFHTNLTTRLEVGGKIRLAEEGFNITVGGTKDAIREYMRECMEHWSFQGLDLDTEQKQHDFFKPSTGGCACAFGGAPASVRVAAEITPMGVTNYSPKNWDDIEVLSPADFHERCFTEDITLLDVRNHYESRIGYFIDPKTGDPALRPPIRRFSQWPQYVRKYMTNSVDEDKEKKKQKGKQILTFCTGGIRCEKGARYMQENMEKQPGASVATLKGGIAAYLTWMDEEIRHGRKRPEESLFKGRNYVFDARGSTSLDGISEPVSKCHGCGNPSDRLGKCRSTGCHLVLVVCSACELSLDPRCCQSCLDMDLGLELNSNAPKNIKSRTVCECEQKRETELWGEGSRKLPKSRRADKEKNARQDINIQVKVID
ncbi:hypothetical protein HYFRA_00006460 [Hymenoscyphus fraxineus]|uniref:Rhodanese domain-containing protein n=1 Tax=Hymenoscyphus fraxineus TaxID=746836 RepID=A0A9N9KS63_9HELO|nr:hypothetical protein HYFRA_00006460 [Hymenoscyphus fraxineus]